MTAGKQVNKYLIFIIRESLNFNIFNKIKGLKTGASLWPGSEVIVELNNIIQQLSYNNIWQVRTRAPDVYASSSRKMDFYDRIDEFTHWMYKFDLDLTLVYFNEPDSCGKVQI